MKKSLIGVIMGILIIVVGYIVMSAYAVSAPWKPRQQALARWKTIEISYPYTSDWYTPIFFSETYFGETKDWKILGMIDELNPTELNYSFNFYVFSGENLDLWLDGETDVESYVTKTIDIETDPKFTFPINKDDIGDLQFVVEAPVVEGERRAFKLHAVTYWLEKETLGYVVVGLFIGGVFTVVGLLTTTLCGIYYAVTTKKEAPSKAEITRMCPQCGKASEWFKEKSNVEE